MAAGAGSGGPESQVTLKAAQPPSLLSLSPPLPGRAPLPPSGFGLGTLARLEEEHSNLPEVEVDEMLRLVRHVGPEVAPHDRVPGRVVLLVELLLDVRRNVLLNVVLLKSLSGSVEGRGGEGVSVFCSPQPVSGPVPEPGRQTRHGPFPTDPEVWGS